MFKDVILVECYVLPYSKAPLHVVGCFEYADMERRSLEDTYL